MKELQHGLQDGELWFSSSRNFCFPKVKRGYKDRTFITLGTAEEESSWGPEEKPWSQKQMQPQL